MSELKLTPAQRRAGVDDAAQSMALRSGAGCGKTFVLARRYTQLLTGYGPEDTPLRSLVALTFTEKAAGEMSQRVRLMLCQQARAASGGRRKQLRRWMDELPEARISTIHSFCASLLRANAIEAGIDPNFAVCADALLTAQLREDACDAALLAAAEADDAQLAGLLEYLSYYAARYLLTTLVSNRHVLDAEAHPSTEEIIARWQAVLEETRREAWKRMEDDSAIAELDAYISSRPCSNPDDKLLAKREEMMPVVTSILRDAGARTAENLAFVSGFAIGGVGTAGAWGSKEEVRDLRRAMMAIRESFKEYAPYAESLNEMDDRAADALAALTSLAGDAEKRYAADKRRRGLLDFDDLIIAASRLIRSNPSVRRRLAGEIDQLLVDECQDTDAFQLQMLERLVSADENPDTQAFVVGDAMQSIYRFRGADVDEFENICSRLGRGNVERLDLSFRTHPAGIAFVNHVFGELMGERYEPITAHRGTSPPHESVEILLADMTEGIDNAADASAAQAALTAQRIAEMIANEEKLIWDDANGTWRPVQPRDVAILLSRMTDSLEYERQLQKRNVPYYVVAGSGFFKQQEVFDILNALRIIDNPLDDIALFGVLRSSLVGLDDDALMHIAEALGSGPYLDKLTSSDRGDLSDRLSGDQLEALGFAVGLLGRLARRKNAVGIGELIEQLLDETGYEAVLASRFGAKRLIGNVRQLVDRARAAGDDGMSLDDFLNQTGQLVLDESRYEQAVVSGESDNVVRLMTVHKAKGLEFGVVVLPDLNAARRGSSGPLLYRRADWSWTLNVKPDPDEDDTAENTPLSYRLAKTAERDDLDREDIRRLYVAVTRHRDHLVLIGADYRTKDGLLRDGKSDIGRLDGVFDISDEITDEDSTIPCGDSGFNIRVRRIIPKPSRPASSETPGRKAIARASCGRDLAGAMLAGAPEADPPELTGPLPASLGRAEIAVTALSEFEHCEMLYRWRYELAVPTPAGDSPTAAPHDGIPLDAATLGTLYHRCMELLDFSDPQPAESLVQQAIWEMDLDETVNIEAPSSELQAMISRFGEHDLCRQLIEAKQTFRELDFTSRVGPLTLRGQIDMLYCDADGRWRVVDYKSDRVSGDDDEKLRGHAGRYELQMLAYAVAAGRHLGEAVADATLYFLRPGRAHTFRLDGNALDAAEERISALGTRLITARRSGAFQRTESAQCDYCPYSSLCG